MIGLPKRVASEDGFTITEMMVVVLLLSVLIGVFYSFLFGGERAARDGRNWLEANQNARLALERMSRELREADQILSVGGETQIEFQADLDQSGAFATVTYTPDITDEEKITYTYDGGADELKVNTAVTGTASAVLASNIGGFRFRYFASDPKVDIGCSGFNGTAPSDCAAGDGTVHWQELDWAEDHSPPLLGYGDDDGSLSNAELNHVTQIVIEMTVGIRNQRHEYRATVELRNMFR
jgi:prepilin-type N-terminal cleavage/methylation domain-containing protein